MLRLSFAQCIVYLCKIMFLRYEDFTFLTYCSSYRWHSAAASKLWVVYSHKSFYQSLSIQIFVWLCKQNEGDCFTICCTILIAFLTFCLSLTANICKINSWNNTYSLWNIAILDNTITIYKTVMCIYIYWLIFWKWKNNFYIHFALSKLWK